MNQKQSSECSGCSSEQRFFLHHVRYRGSLRRLCTSCVLKIFAGSFCPVCFEVYEGSPSDRVECLKCISISHLACVSPELVSGYVCPSCANPTFSFFDVGTAGKITIDQAVAKVLLAAARISAASMSRAVMVARIEAERKAREAAVAKKRAKEALDRLVSAVPREKEKGEESKKGVLDSSVMVAEQKKKLKGSSAVAEAIAVQKRIQDHVRESPIGVGSRKKEKWLGYQVPIMAQPISMQRPSDSAIDIEEKVKLKGSLISVLESQHHLQPSNVDESVNPTRFSYLENHNIQDENEEIEYSVPLAGQLQRPLSSHVKEEEKGKLKGISESEMDPRILQSI